MKKFEPTIKTLDAKFNHLDAKFDQLMDFLREHMVTRTELVALEERLEQKFASQKSIDVLYNAFDNFAKETLRERQEHSIKNYRLTNIEKWVKIASRKLNIPYTP